jgi:hypothetical protein
MAVCVVGSMCRMENDDGCVVVSEGRWEAMLGVVSAMRGMESDECDVFCCFSSPLC